MNLTKTSSKNFCKYLWNIAHFSWIHIRWNTNNAKLLPLIFIFFLIIMFYHWFLWIWKKRKNFFFLFFFLSLSLFYTLGEELIYLLPKKIKIVHDGIVKLLFLFFFGGGRETRDLWVIKVYLKWQKKKSLYFKTITNWKPYWFKVI